MQGHFISTVVGLFFSFSVLAQPLQGVVENNYTYRHFTLSDGLPQIQCLTLSSDSRGFVWVGTKFGAARWDGRQFTIFNRKNGTRGDLMNCFSESDDGSLLAGFLNVSFSIISGNFVQSYSLPVSGGEYSIQQSFSLGRKQSLILAVPRFIDSSGFESRLFVFDRNTRSFTRQFRLQAKSIDLLNTEGSILGFSQYKQDETGPLLVSYYKWDKLISNRRFFCRIFPHGGSNNRNTLLEFPSLPGRWYTLSVRDNQVDTTLAYEIKSPDFNSKSVRMAFITGNHKTAYYYDNSSRIMKSSGNSIESIGQIPFVNDIYEDNAGNLWVSSEQGLYSFFRQTFKEIKFNVNPGQYDDIWSVSHDRKGSYFYSSWHNRSWQSVDGNKTWKKMDWVYQDKLLSKIVTGSFGGCSTQLGGTLLPTGYDFYYLHPPSRARLFHLPTQLQIFGTLEDSVKHEIYIHQFAALYRLNELSLKLDPLILPADKITNSIIQLCFDKDNRLVVFGRGGPLRLEDGKWKKLKHLPMDVLSATRDFAGNLWVSDWLNLCIYKYDTLIRLKYLPSREMTIALTTYKNRWLVIGGSADLTFMDLDAFYKTGKEIYYRFDAGSGLNILEGGQNNFYHDLDGTILWPCSDKLIRIFPERLLHAEVPNVPQVMLGKAYNQNGHFILLADTSGKTGFFLPHGYRNLEFTFAAAVFNNNEVLKYRYRLSGYNELWSEPNNLTEANFDNVPPGKYRFEVQSSINGEDWSESSFSDTVVVPSYFYETSLYKILMFIVAILAVAVLTILLTQRIRRIKYLQLKQQQQINDLKIQAIRSKSIPHFTGNIYNNIDYLIENQQYTDASLYLALLSRIHNKVLQDADKPSHSLREELDFVETYIKLEKLRFKDNLSFTVSVKPGVNLDVQIPIMIIHTYVENAIKHGLMSKKGKGEVSLEIDCNEGGTWIRVKDDGIGREEANRKNKDSTGIGLTIFEKQIELYNLGNRNPILQQVDDLTAPDGSSAGTRFSLYVPFEYTFNF